MKNNLYLQHSTKHSFMTSTSNWTRVLDQGDNLLVVGTTNEGYPDPLHLPTFADAPDWNSETNGWKRRLPTYETHRPTIYVPWTYSEYFNGRKIPPEHPTEQRGWFIVPLGYNLKWAQVFPPDDEYPIQESWKQFPVLVRNET